MIKMPEAIFPKQERPWLDGAVMLLLGMILGTILGAGAWEFLRYDTPERAAIHQARNEALIQRCRMIDKLPVTEKGWYRDCR